MTFNTPQERYKKTVAAHSKPTPEIEDWHPIPCFTCPACGNLQVYDEKTPFICPECNDDNEGISRQAEVVPAATSKEAPNLEQASEIDKFGGTSRIDTMPIAQKNAYAANQLADSFNLNRNYWYKYATENNIDLLPYLRRIDAEPDAQKRMDIISEGLDRVSGTTTHAEILLERENMRAADELSHSPGLDKGYLYAMANKHGISLREHRERVDTITDIAEKEKYAYTLMQAIHKKHRQRIEEQRSAAGRPIPRFPAPQNWTVQELNGRKQARDFPSVEEAITQANAGSANSGGVWRVLSPDGDIIYRAAKSPAKTDPSINVPKRTIRIPRKQSFTYAPIQPSNGLTPKDAAIERKPSPNCKPTAPLCSKSTPALSAKW